MKKLTLQVSKRPNPESSLAARRTRVPNRVVKHIFGTSAPEHQMAIILPGRQVQAVDVRIKDDNFDDLTALMDAVKRHPSTRAEAAALNSEVAG